VRPRQKCCNIQASGEIAEHFTGVLSVLARVS